MASKKSNADKGKSDLFAGFDDIVGGKDKAKTSGSKAAKDKAAAAKEDPLADLESMTKGSRPQTPRPGSSAATAGAGKKAATAGTSARASEDNKAGAAEEATTSPAAAAQGSEEKAEEKDPVISVYGETGGGTTSAATGDGDKGASAAAAEVAGGGGSGWWGGFGGLMGAASAAVKQAQSQAEMLARELQKNEEAQRWADHVKGNAALLRSYGGDLRNITGEIRSRALPGLTNLLHTLAPPISSHERLQVHVTHDMNGYPSLNPLVHSVFSRVMAQVEGGDLLVLQRGQESDPRASSSGDAEGEQHASSTAGWSDGPWWRDVTRPREMGAVGGLIEASKLARASAEAYADEHFTRMYGASTDGSTSAVEEARRRAEQQAANESNPTRSSDIFMAVQAVRQAPRQPEGLFAAAGASSPAAAGKEKESKDKGDDQEEEDKDAEVSFAIYLHDPVNSLAFGVVSQPLPARWIRWLDLPAETLEAVRKRKQQAAEKSQSENAGSEKASVGAEGKEDSANEADDEGDDEEASAAIAHLPNDIAALIAAGGLDPREWAAEWIEEALALAVGVLAQRYVACRMGVGEGVSSAVVAGIRTGKAEEAGAGELARAM